MKLKTATMIVITFGWCKGKDIRSIEKQFTRSQYAKKPTELGAMRMLAKNYNDNRFDPSIALVKPCDFRIERIEEFVLNW